MLSPGHLIAQGLHQGVLVEGRVCLEADITGGGGRLGEEGVIHDVDLSDPDRDFQTWQPPIRAQGSLCGSILFFCLLSTKNDLLWGGRGDPRNFFLQCNPHIFVSLDPMQIFRTLQ